MPTMVAHSPYFPVVPALIAFVATSSRQVGGVVFGLMALLVLGSPAFAADEAEHAPQAQAEAQAPERGAPEQGPFYTVGRFELDYLRDHPDLPPTERYEQVEVALGRADEGWLAPHGEAEAVAVTIGELAADEPRQYSAQAIQRILEALHEAITYHGVSVAPDPRDIGEQGQDLRDSPEVLRIIITVGRVTELRTVAAGERIDPDERVNHPAHERIRQRSPLQPADPESEAPGDLIEPRELDEYAFFLSRHPGRRADVALYAAEELSGTALDYIITENKPWSVYAQLSNTGTAQTDRLRQQFGFFHNQLTGNDDIFNLQYLTANFDSTHAVRASYEAPLFDADRVRWNIYGSWSEFTASDIGFFDDTFTGETFDYGASLVANVYQYENLFFDLFAGARMLDVEVDNTIPGSERAREQFFLPHVGAALEKHSAWYNNHDRVQLEWHTPGVTSINDGELNALGRTNPDREWAVLSWDLSHAVFVEPIIYDEDWRDPTTPATSTLAHELYARVHGQHSFGSRLVPQLEQVAGGQYTVRGYPESATAGDTVLIGNFEYRFHVPRLFRIEEQPREMFGGPFRFAPQYVYGAPDWDFAPRAFFDVARVITNSNEGTGSVPDETLASTGIGFDFLYQRNLRFSLDWGFVLQTLENDEAEYGDEHLHFTLTVLY